MQIIITTRELIFANVRQDVVDFFFTQSQTFFSCMLEIFLCLIISIILFIWLILYKKHLGYLAKFVYLP